MTSGLDQLVTQVADKGVQGGGTDGKPVVTTTIGSFTLQVTDAPPTAPARLARAIG